MQLYCSRFPVPATLGLFASCPLLFAAPLAAPVPDHEKTVTESPQSPARVAALRRWNEAKFKLFLHWGVYSVDGGTDKGQELWSAEWIQENARIASLGGNYLLNVGPIAGQQDGPFVVVELLVEGTPAAAAKQRL